jgi:aminocarboxymuconate-semialdehyde decarboxylase
MPIIDMHTHTISKRVEPLIAGQYDPMDNPYRRDMSLESRATDAEQGKLLPRLMLDVAARRQVSQQIRRQNGLHVR